MLPKKGRKLPAWEGALASRQAYAEVIANLLRKEHGDTHRAVKQLMSWASSRVSNQPWRRLP